MPGQTDPSKDFASPPGNGDFQMNRDAPCLLPKYDTWRHFKYAACWMWSPRSRPWANGVASLNPWSAAEVTTLLDALRPIARLRSALLNGPPGTPLPASEEHAWVEGTMAHADFERFVGNALRGAPFPVTGAELFFDLCAWVHTSTNQEPVRGWILGAAYVDLQFELDDPYGALSMDHTLFRDGNTHGASNAGLHRLNQPLLEAALGTIEARLGPIVDVEGLPDVTRTGFTSQKDS